MDPACILEVASLFYEPKAPRSIQTNELRALAPNLEVGELEEIILALAEKKLIRLSLNRETAYPTLFGKEAYEDRSIVALTLGPRHLSDCYRGAVVHIIVDGPDGEQGATGFYCADFTNCIITAAHVVRNRRVLRVENSRGNTVCDGPTDIIVGPQELDIAVIRCQMPDGIEPIKIEWRSELVQPLDHVLILGYPPFPNHQPALFHALADIHAIPKDYRGIEKLVVSSITRPGCSGGPLISERGFVVGIVEQENTLEIENQTHAFFTATMARYIAEFMPRD